MISAIETDRSETLAQAADEPAPYELIVRSNNLESAQMLVLQLQTIKEYLLKKFLNKHGFNGVNNADELVSLAPLFEFDLFTSSIIYSADRLDDYWLVIIQSDVVILLIQALEDFLEQNNTFRESWLSEGLKLLEPKEVSESKVDHQAGYEGPQPKEKFRQLDIYRYEVTPPKEMRVIPQPVLKMALDILYGSKRAGRIDGFLKSGWMYEEVGSIDGVQKTNGDKDSNLLLPVEMIQQIFNSSAEELANTRMQIARLRRPLKVGEQSLRRLQLAICFVHNVGWDSLQHLQRVLAHP